MRPSRSGGFCLHADPAALPAPVLSWSAGLNFAIANASTVPDHWRVYVSLDAGASFSSVTTIAGNAVSYTAAVYLGLYKIQGETSGNVAQGPFSNTVTVTGFGDAPVLSFDGVDTLNWTWDGGQPNEWVIYSSSDGGSTWDRFDGAGGDQRSHNGIPGSLLWYVVGADPFDTPTTDASNQVSS